MKTLLEVLQDAENRRVAVGHFNFSELTVLKAVGEAARELDTAVVVGVSESEREFVGVREAVALVKAMRDEGLQIFLNADHTHSLEKGEEAARAGFDMVVFDASEKPIEENIALTRRAVETMKSINAAILVEGEIGYIGSGSEVHDKRPENTPHDRAGGCARFCRGDARRLVVAVCGYDARDDSEHGPGR